MKFILIWFSCRVLVALLWRKRARQWFSVYTRSPWHQGSVTWSWRGWETTWLIKACRSSQHNGFHIFRFFCFLFVGFASTFLLWIWSGTGVLAQNNHVQMVRRKQGTIWCSKIVFFFFFWGFFFSWFVYLFTPPFAPTESAAFFMVLHTLGFHLCYDTIKTNVSAINEMVLDFSLPLLL